MFLSWFDKICAADTVPMVCFLCNLSFFKKSVRKIMSHHLQWNKSRPMDAKGYYRDLRSILNHIQLKLVLGRGYHSGIIYCQGKLKLSEREIWQLHTKTTDERDFHPCEFMGIHFSNAMRTPTVHQYLVVTFCETIVTGMSLLTPSKNKRLSA